MSADVWLLVISGDPFKQVDTCRYEWRSTCKPTHTHTVWTHTLSHATSVMDAVYKKTTRIITTELCSVVVWHFGNESSIKRVSVTDSVRSASDWSSVFCSDISLWAQSSLAFTRCRVKLCELLEIFRGKVLCLMPMPAHHSETSHTDSEHVPLWPSMSVVLWPKHA